MNKEDIRGGPMKSKPRSFCHNCRQVLLIYFQNTFSNILGSKFAVMCLLKIPSHPARVTTLPCEIQSALE